MSKLPRLRLVGCLLAMLGGSLGFVTHADAARGGGVKLLKAAGAEEMWLAVAVNGQLTGTTVLVRYDHGDGLWVGEAELRSWRLSVPAKADTSLPGTTLYPLHAFNGLTFRVDETNQTLALDVPAGLFDSVQVSGKADGYVAATPPPPGGFFNYDLVALTGLQGIGANALLEAGAFGHLGTGVTRFIERKQQSGVQSVRLDSTWTYDRPASLASLRLGDSITGASRLWGGAVRFGGVQWASNFATQPGLVTMPLPSVGGESALPSTLELYVNDALRMRQEMPEGPFTVRDVPIVSGDGQIRVVVRDLLGREQVISQSYYSSPQLLRPGLHDYSFEAGAVRENFSLASNDYGRPVIAGTERYGFTERFTGEIHAELLEDQQAVGLAGGLLVPHIGMLSAAIAGSASDAGTGRLVALGIERTSARFSIGVNAELASASFRRLGLLADEPVPRLKGQVFTNVALGRAGSVSLMAARQAFQGGEITDLMTLRHSIDLRGLGYLNLSALRVKGTDRDTIIGLSFSRSLGNRANASLNITSKSDGLSGYAQMQKSLPAGTGLGYRMRARTGEMQGAAGSVSYQNNIGTYTLEAEQTRAATDVRASITGGVALMSAGLFASRRIDSSFAVARVGEEADVRVYRDNQLVGRTNANGLVILPGLRAYEDNQISIEQADLPLDVTVGALYVKAVPAYRSGLLLTFPVERARGAMLMVLLEDGQPLPAGAVVTMPDEPDAFPTGMRGEVYVSHLAKQNRLRASWTDGACEFDVAYTPSDDPLPQLGPFECRAIAP